MLILGSGGLGNQLFSLAMSLDVSRKTEKSVWLLTNNKELKKNFRRAKKRSKRTIRVRILYSPKLYDSAHMGIGKLSKVLSGSPKFDRVCRRLIFTFSESWDFEFDLNKRPLFLRGHFQSADLIHNLSREDARFVESMFNGNDLNINRSNVKKLIGWHSRRGDYLEIPGYGVLSIDFFLGILNSLPQGADHLIISSDDKQFLDSISCPSVASKLYPDRVSPWETIDELSQADIFIMSNSTLSFWIGWLVSRRGGKVFAPTPWFRSQNTPPNYLYLESFHKVKSIFV